MISTLNQVIESADKMRSNGQTNVQMQVKLDDGQQLTIRLQMSQGSIHPTFKTESPELRQAIEQNWGGFRTAASERGLQISTPVFESHGAGSSFDPSGGRNQSRDSGNNPADPETQDFSPRQNLQSNGKQTVSQPQAASLSGSGVQLYA